MLVAMEWTSWVQWEKLVLSLTIEAALTPVRSRCENASAIKPTSYDAFSIFSLFSAKNNVYFFNLEFLFLSLLFLVEQGDEDLSGC